MVNQIDSTRDFAHKTLQQPKSDSHLSDRLRPNSRFRLDELIASLANAHENRRARQVTEWERIRQHNFPAAV